jgi:hypothetical protein
VNEVTGRGRDRIYAYQEYLAVLNEGTDVPATASSEPPSSPLAYERKLI